MPPPLLSRTLDPILGVFTGVFAYYLHETNPRTAPSPDQRITALIQWKLAKRQRELEAKSADDALDSVDWKELVAEEKGR